MSTTPGKGALKGIVRLVCLALVAPPAFLYYLFAMVAGRGRAFPGFSQLFALIPGVTGVYLRWAFYRMMLPECGEDAHVGFGTVISHPTARIGRKVYVGVYCVLGDVTLEDDVLLGSHVSVINGSRQHGIDRLDVPIREQPGVWPRVTVGRDSWVGDRSVICADVGDHCVIGAGAVVTKPIPDYSVAVGVPARVVRSRLQVVEEAELSRGVLESSSSDY